ncbi:hypothetical protein EDD65_11289 [Keratinibaculum paraultunense]|uniref:DUF4209 domain-containing protein n=1 Tax=Keratinibaculum paraultunense TaxID=1278232 RepID=A0A4R3KR93_9FIRM|nr:hypothetical protein [Keratinibaculum paraultunense]QQY79703.1 hypothetical protein JL105_11080 [Keratinibaculum paraultunense]TCS87131.1 hypothetical protein EDD65_11289 [Keratinibaculum paraultunense]
MRNILNVLNENGTYMTVKYYGLNDLATPNDLKNIIDNRILICDYYMDKDFTKDLTLNDFIDYLVLKKIIEIQEIIPYIKNKENQESFQNLILKLEGKYKEFSVGNIIKFININIKTIFMKEREIYDIKNVTLDLCIKYQGGISEDVFLYLIDNYSYLIFDNYDKLQKTLENQTTLFEKLFSKDIVENAINYRLSKIGDIIASVYNRKKENLYDYLDIAVNTIINYGESIMNKLSIDNIMEHQNTIYEIYNILKRINHIKGNQFEGYVEVSEEIMDKYLKEKGKVITYEIPVVDIIKMLKSDMPWEFKPLSLTHSYDKECDIMKSNLNFPPKEETSFLDLVSSNIDSDDYFTFSHQQNLNVYITVGTAAIFSIMNDKKLFVESLIWYIGYLEFICQELRYGKKDIIFDMKLLYNMLDNIFSNIGELDDERMQSLCYGPSMYICAFTENILRVTYKYIKQDEEYVPSSIGTIGQYLSIENEVIKEILGEYQVKHLLFYFGKTQETKIGYNYRNKLAHWNEIQKKELSPQLVCKLFFLMINVINSIFYYFYEKRRENF